jgi:hypothetical protein
MSFSKQLHLFLTTLSFAGALGLAACASEEPEPDRRPTASLSHAEANQLCTERLQAVSDDDMNALLHVLCIEDQAVCSDAGITNCVSTLQRVAQAAGPPKCEFFGDHFDRLQECPVTVDQFFDCYEASFTAFDAFADATCADSGDVHAAIVKTPFVCKYIAEECSVLYSEFIRKR